MTKNKWNARQERAKMKNSEKDELMKRATKSLESIAATGELLRNVIYVCMFAIVSYAVVLTFY